MALIPLSKRGTVYRGKYAATVDDCHLGWLSDFNWRACRQGSAETQRIYAVRRIYDENGKAIDLRMHRVIYERVHGPIPHGFEIDHVEPGLDGGLDNRIANLRLTTKSLNQANSRKGRNNTSGYKGVWWHPGAAKWRADLWVRGRKIHLGYFVDKIDAARAYDSAALCAFGSHARLNLQASQ